MTDLAVRTADVADLAEVEPLVADALGRLRALRGGGELLVTLGVPADVPPDALASALCGATLYGVACLVAVLDDAVVGLAVCVRTSEGVDLLGVHTHRSLRRRRIGTTLLDAVRALAAEDGARFEALTLPGDQSVKSLLEAAGFKARLLRMSGGR